MATLDRQIAAGADDGTRNASGTVSAGFDTLLVGDPFGEQEGCWLRFGNLPIPQGATVTAAYITFTGDDTGLFDAATLDAEIFGIDEDDHAAPASSGDYNTDHAAHTTASAAWSLSAAASGSIQSPSLVSIVQEIVDRGGWAPGNAMGFHVGCLASNTGCQEFVSYDQTPGDSAVLHIEIDGEFPATPLAGTPVEGAGAISPAPHAETAEGDFMVLAIENWGNDSAPAEPTDWDPVPDSPQVSGTDTATDRTRLTLFYKIAGSSEGSVSVGDTGNHQVAVIVTIPQSLVDTSDPFVDTAGVTDATNDTSAELPALDTTGVDGCLVVYFTSAGDDVTRSSWASASLASIAELVDALTTSGNDGSIGVAYGVDTTGGTINAGSVTTSASEETASIGIALRPASTGTPATVTPAAIAVSVAVPGPTVTASSLVTPAAVAAAVTLPTPSKLAASLVTPAAIAAAATLPGATVVVSKTVTPAAVAASASVPTPSIIAASIVEPLSIEAIVALPQPTPSIGQIVEPDPVSAAVSIPTPTVLGAAIVTPAAIAVSATLPTPSAAVEALRTPAVIAITTTLPGPSVAAASVVTPMAIEVNVAIPSPTLFTGVLEILARVFGQFHRISNRLHLAQIGRGGRKGFSVGEGWERVSDPFIYDGADGEPADQEATMQAVAGAWAAHAGSDADTLKAAIHSALDALGYRRTDGTRLV